MRYVIIGNSAAAVGCIEGIRTVDKTGEIVVVSKEPYPVYSRPLISYLLCGKTDRERMNYRPADFYEKNGVRTVLGVRAEKLYTKEQEVLLANGERISYDKLLLATGSDPFVPPMEGLETVQKQFHFMSLDDALALDKELAQDKKVLIVGAGLIGLKCAEGIGGRCAQITVVDLADRILPSILDAEASGAVQSHLEKHGISFFLSDSVASFAGNRAILKSGAEIDFDLLVIAVGVRPNIQLAEGTQIETQRGIVTDQFCRTSVENVYAAGDCAQSRDVATDSDRVLALMPNAYMQGECAGIHMAGGSKPYDFAIAMNAVGFFGLHMITAGSYDGEEILRKTKNSYKKLFIRDGRLVGYILLGDVRRAGIYTAMIRNRARLDEVDFDMLLSKPQLAAFSKDARKNFLGGVPVWKLQRD